MLTMGLLLLGLGSAEATPPRTYAIEPDPRDCAWPMCGGWFLREVNQKRTRCADGTRADACYVAELDLSALGLDPATEAELVAAMSSDGALVRGPQHLDTFVGWELGVLAVKRAWIDVTW